MSLSKDLLHSPLLDEITEKLKASIEAGDGLTPEQLRNEDILFLYEMGYNLYQAGDYAKAEEIFKRLTVSKPYEGNFWKSFASSLQMQNKWEEALVPWSMLCLIDPDNPLPHFHAAECLFTLNQPEEGKKALQAAKNRDTAKAFAEKIALLEEVWK